MATVRWIGGAAAVAQVQTFALGGTWEVGDIIRVVIGQKKWDYSVLSTVIATLGAAFVTAFNAISSTDYPEFGDITASGTSTISFTADAAGAPFTITLTPLESNASAADAQTIEGAGIATTGTAATACTGPTFWSDARNWSGGAVPVNSDTVVIEDSSDAIKDGLDQSAVTLASLIINASFTGTLGRETINRDGTAYPEYRSTYLAVGATAQTIGQGEGSGSPMLKINNGTAQTTLVVRLTGSSNDGITPPLIWKGTHASNVVSITGGQIAAAYYGGETAVIATLNIGLSAQGDANVLCGSGVTLTTVNQGGGTVVVNGALTTLTKIGGTFVSYAGAITTLTNDAGLVVWSGTGTITTLNNSGEFDGSQDMRAFTITNANLYRDCVLDDSNARVTWTNPFRLVRCTIEQVTLRLGYNRTLAPG